MTTLSKGDRVILCDTGSFGTVYRAGILGLKSVSYVISVDNGKIVAYTGKVALKHAVNAADSNNSRGDLYGLPVDIKITGVPMLDDAAVSKTVQTKILRNFTNISGVEKSLYTERWLSVGDNPVEQVGLMMRLS